MKFILGLFFIIHGLIHLSFIAPQPPKQQGAPAWPFSVVNSWLGLSPQLLKPIGISLTLVAAIGFIAVGLGTLGLIVPEAWVKLTAIISAIASLLLMAIFWHPWFVVGFALSALILAWFSGLRISK